MAVDNDPPETETTVNKVTAPPETKEVETIAVDQPDKTSSDTDTDTSDEDVNEGEIISEDDGSMKSTSSSEDQPFKYHCNNCNLYFKFNCWFQRHMSTHRPGTYACNHCPKFYKRKDILREHEILHTGGRKFECKECAKVFSDKRNLNAHVKMVHKDCLIKCPKCDKLYSGKRQLRYHNNRMHSLKTPYKCDMCGAAFPVPCMLSAHRVKMDHHNKLNNKC